MLHIMQFDQLELHINFMLVRSYIVVLYREKGTSHICIDGVLRSPVISVFVEFSTGDKSALFV